VRVIIAGRLSRKTEERDQTGFDSQERDSIRWAESRGHEVIAVVADYKTGRAGLEARPNLRPWVTDPEKLAQYDAIVALKVDRLTRGNRAETRELEQWATDHGKELWITEADVHFPSEGVDGIQWDMMLRLAHQEWLNISERYTRMQRTLRARGSVVGSIPWGMRIEAGFNAKGEPVKVFTPTAPGRKYVPEIFSRIIAGDSLRDVAEWLASEGVVRDSRVDGGQWSEMNVSQLVRNPVYHGRRRNGGELVTEALVTVADSLAADAALKARIRTGRGTSKLEKALLSPVCGNSDCDATGRDKGPSPMYRVIAEGHAYYRCTGRGPRRRGCGNRVRLAELDQLVITEMCSDHMNMHTERVFIPGDTSADDVARLRELAMDAYRAGDKAKFMELDAQAEELASQGGRESRWIERETGETRGEHFASLSLSERREELSQRWQVMAWNDPEAGVCCGILPLWSVQA
jgi:site-specific DNA recombinase